ncbi:sugar kinase [Micromonospora sp. DR5-3]|uniref:sugar kinase n=1 Tax=unclassified Micromonospora TaxID=2617518 RepID=UPI0011D914AB|nr:MULTISPECIES: sugar kinase [unclassified Micromonospora]MCW3814421.1 sugar kinase [Micromonospora sp. DR5-3]TYC19704.1 sugar kinase [Micromonospora sp. MP36]
MTTPAALARLDLVGLGEAMVLFQPPPGALLHDTGAVEVHVAGAEFNLCVAAARLGIGAGFCSRVGADPLGRRVLAEAEAAGVDAALVAVDPEHPTGLFLKDARPDGQRRVYYYRRGSAAAHLDEADAARLLAARPRMVAVSGVTLALGPGPRAAVASVVRDARRVGTAVALDPNLRPALGAVERQAADVRALLGQVDVLLLGTDEAGPVLGVRDPSDPDAVFAAAAAAGVRETVLKAGAGGCYHAGGTRGAVHLPSAATVVVDPVGAGDAFAGGYLTGRLRGVPPAGAAALGNALAAAVVAAPGDTAGLPDRSSAAALLDEVRSRWSGGSPPPSG